MNLTDRLASRSDKWSVSSTYDRNTSRDFENNVDDANYDGESDDGWIEDSDEEGASPHVDNNNPCISADTTNDFDRLQGTRSNRNIDSFQDFSVTGNGKRESNVCGTFIKTEEGETLTNSQCVQNPIPSVSDNAKTTGSIKIKKEVVDDGYEYGSNQHSFTSCVDVKTEALEHYGKSNVGCGAHNLQEPHDQIHLTNILRTDRAVKQEQGESKYQNLEGNRNDLHVMGDTMSAIDVKKYSSVDDYVNSLIKTSKNRSVVLKGPTRLMAEVCEKLNDKIKREQGLKSTFTTLGSGTPSKGTILSNLPLLGTSRRIIIPEQVYTSYQTHPGGKLPVPAASNQQKTILEKVEQSSVFPPLQETPVNNFDTVSPALNNEVRNTPTGKSILSPQREQMRARILKTNAERSGSRIAKTTPENGDISNIDVGKSKVSSEISTIQRQCENTKGQHMLHCKRKNDGRRDTNYNSEGMRASENREKHFVSGTAREEDSCPADKLSSTETLSKEATALSCSNVRRSGRERKISRPYSPPLPTKRKFLQSTSPANGSSDSNAPHTCSKISSANDALRAEPAEVSFPSVKHSEDSPSDLLLEKPACPSSGEDHVASLSSKYKSVLRSGSGEDPQKTASESKYGDFKALSRSEKMRLLQQRIQEQEEALEMMRKKRQEEIERRKNDPDLFDLL